MTAIITADIIDSRKAPDGQWLKDLKTFFATLGQEPAEWEFYRGDAFQLETDPADAFRISILIKSLLGRRRLDARMSIGIGEKTIQARKISESNGPAFVRSGELFETLKPQKLVLAIDSGHAEIDEELNLLMKLSSALMANWLPQSAEFVFTALHHPELSQEELGRKLGITQAAISRRRKRSQFDLIMETENFYRKTLNRLT